MLRGISLLLILLCGCLPAAVSAAPAARELHEEANAVFERGDVAKAKAMFVRAAEQAADEGDSLTLAAAWSDLGVCHRVGGDADSALILYNRALAVFEKIDAPADEASLLTSIAVLYANQGRFDESIKFGRRAFAKAKESGDAEAIMYAGQTLGIVLYLSGHKAEGFAIEREMVEIAERMNLPRYILKTYASIIDMHYKDGRQDSVDYYMARGRAVFPRVPEESVEALGFLEESYVVLTAAGRFRESLDIQKKILSIEGGGKFMPLNKLYLRMARNYRGLGDTDSMAWAYERASALTDSLHGLEIDRQLSEFDVRYDTALRELEITRLEAEKTRQRDLTVILATVFAASLGAIGLWLRFRRLRRRREAELEKTRARLEVLDSERARFACELHDGVCSELTGIGLLLQTGSTSREELADIVDGLRQEVRSISHRLMPPRFDSVSLPQLLQTFTLTPGCTVHTPDPAPEYAPQTAFQLYRIVQEWLENIGRHSKATETHITLDGRTLSIADNGDPWEWPSAEKTSDGIGRDTVALRARSIGAKVDFARSGGQNILTVTF